MTTAPHQLPARLSWLDTARGAALVAMIAYHGAWDLSLLGLWSVDVYGSVGWTAFARTIAFSFLFLVGMSLVAAHRRGVPGRAILRRLVLICGAAAVITTATLIATPQTPILFGILHCIAAASVLGLAFVRLPGRVALLAALATGALWWSDVGALDHIGFVWLGLRSAPPASLDYVPLVPWFAATLLGIAFAKAVPGLFERSGVAISGLEWMGRRSLAVYLLHQPILFAVLYPLSRLA